MTWLLPFIGHTGIGSSDGVIHDFIGTKNVRINKFGFGKTFKYVPLEVNFSDSKRFNECIHYADKLYSERTHKLFSDNCHSHIAVVLNEFKYMGRTNYSMVDVWWLLIRRGRYVSLLACLRTYAVFCLLVIVLTVGVAIICTF